MFIRKLRRGRLADTEAATLGSAVANPMTSEADHSAYRERDAFAVRRRRADGCENDYARLPVRNAGFEESD